MQEDWGSIRTCVKNSHILALPLISWQSHLSKLSGSQYSPLLNGRSRAISPLKLALRVLCS